MSGKKFLSLVVLLTSLASLFAGCGPDEPVIETVEVEKVVTEVVEVEKEVTKIVAGTPVVETIVETKVVERIVTATPEPEPEGPKVVRINLWGGYPARMDPQMATRSAEKATIWQTCDLLVQKDREGNLVPGAAEGWEAAADGMSMTFRLRDNLMRADGAPITAQDFEWLFRRIADPRAATRVSGNFLDVAGVPEALALDPEGDSAEIEQALDNVGVKASDDTTLVFTFNKPAAAYFAFFLNDTSACPVDRRVVEADPDTWWTKAENHNSGGPFVMSKIEEQQRITLVPNPYYWGGVPNLDRVEFTYITDSTLAFEAYRKGELDIVTLEPPDRAVVEADAALSQQWLRSVLDQVQFMGIATQIPPFTDVAVRKAFALGFDRETFVRDALQGKGALLRTWLLPGFDAYNENDMQPEYDPAAAVQTLIEAGYGAEDSTAENPKIDCEKLGEIILSYKGTPQSHPQMQLVAGNYASLFSCPITLNPVESATLSTMYLDPATMPMLALQLMGFSLPLAMDVLQPWYSTGTNMGDVMGYYSEPFQQAYEAGVALAGTDPAAAAVEFRRAHQILLLEDYSIFMVNRVEQWWLVKDYLTGFRENSTTCDWQFPGQSGPMYTYDVDLSKVGDGYPSE